jgi:hypothetical protein
MYMYLNIAAPWGWIWKAAETCRSAIVIQTLAQLVGYKHDLFWWAPATVQIVICKHSGNNLRKSPRGSRKKLNTESCRSPKGRRGTAYFSPHRHMLCPCRAVPWPWERILWRHGRDQLWMHESNTVALCNSNGNDTIQIFSDTAWPGHGTACAN